MKLRDKIKLLTAFKEFKKEIKEEMMDPDSKFNKFGLQTNNFGDVIYVQLDFDDAAFMSSDYNSQKMVMHKLKPIDDYLRVDMGWDEPLDLNISQFYDGDDFPTYSYAVKYQFAGVTDIINEIVRSGLFVFGGILFVMFVVILAIIL